MSSTPHLSGADLEALASLEPSLRHPTWENIPPDLWNDWRWQRKHTVRKVAELARLLPFSEVELETLGRLETQYRLAITPYYLSLIQRDDPADPLRLQSVPSPLEWASSAGPELEDPLEEDQDSPMPGLTHRYPDRVLLVTTHDCAMYCRFCTRKRATMRRGGANGRRFDRDVALAYIRQHPEIHDVIVSGGDPLLLPARNLRALLEALAAIDHVDVVRIGTRAPATLPQRLFDPELVSLLREAGKVWVQTHFNHPREITSAAALACRLLVDAGIPVNNQTVLLKGVNDSVETMRALMRALLRIKVRPYYLFHCDPVIGAGHFRTSIWKGMEVIEGLRGHLSGLGVPTYAVDGLHGAGKVPLMPNHLVSASDNAVVLRNYEGLLFRYVPEDRPPDPSGPDGALGVSGLLSGEHSVLAPPDTPRLQRRRRRAGRKADPL